MWGFGALHKPPNKLYPSRGDPRLSGEKQSPGSPALPRLGSLELQAELELPGAAAQVASVCLPVPSPSSAPVTSLPPLLPQWRPSRAPGPRQVFLSRRNTSDMYLLLGWFCLCWVACFFFFNLFRKYWHILLLWGFSRVGLLTLCLLLFVLAFKRISPKTGSSNRAEEQWLPHPPGAELQHHPRTCAWQDRGTEGRSDAGPWIWGLSWLSRALGSVLVLARGFPAPRGLSGIRICNAHVLGVLLPVPSPRAGEAVLTPQAPRGFPASGTPSDDYFSFFFFSLLVVFLFSFVRGLGRGCFL